MKYVVEIDDTIYRTLTGLSYRLIKYPDGKTAMILNDQVQGLEVLDCDYVNENFGEI